MGNTPMILMNDFQRQWDDCREAALAAVERTGRSGWYILGNEVEQFESALARFWGVKYAVGVASGLDAIEIGLRCLGLSAGDKVLTTPLTAFATTLAIIRAGGTPVFVDVDPLGQLDTERCGEILARSNDIHFIVPVHLFGLATSLPGIEALARAGAIVLEDCAQSIAAGHGSIRSGTVGRAAATSFYPTKNLGALGDGGALLCNDQEIAQQARRLRNYGQSAQYAHDELGLNSRLDELHAAVLRDAFLPKLESWTKRRREIAARYLAEIESTHVTPLRPPAESLPSWHLFPVMIAPNERDAFRTHLQDLGIVTGVHYPRLVCEQDALRSGTQFEVVGDLTNARRFATSEVSLPIHPYLTEDEVRRTIAACNQWRP